MENKIIMTCPYCGGDSTITSDHRKFYHLQIVCYYCGETYYGRKRSEYDSFKDPPKDVIF